MKEFKLFQFDPKKCKREIDDLGKLLKRNGELSESKDIKPFFTEREQLTAFIGASIPDIGPANRIAYEFEVFGDFSADAIIGNAEKNTYCAIEFEDARAASVLAKKNRAVTEWGSRLEKGFGQLVDWFFAFDDHKNSAGFTKHFGFGHIQFYGLLIVGRSAHLSEYDMRRLNWRSDRISLNTHKIYVRTFDQLYESLNTDWRMLSLFLDKI